MAALPNDSVACQIIKNKHFNYSEIKKLFVNLCRRYYLSYQTMDLQLLTRECVNNMIKTIEDTKANIAMGFIRLSRSQEQFYQIFDVIEDCEGKYLVLKTKEYKRVVCLEDRFDVILEAHRKAYHGIPQTFEQMDQRYSITVAEIHFFLKLCNVCNEIEKCSRKDIPEEPKELVFNDEVLLDIIQVDVQVFNVEKFKYIICYMDKATRHILLRPQATSNETEIAFELFKIFADFGTPKNIVVVRSLLTFIQGVVDMLNKTFKIGFIEVKAKPSCENNNIRRMIKSKLIKWMENNNTEQWYVGAYVIQQEINNTPQGKSCSRHETVFRCTSNIVWETSETSFTCDDSKNSDDNRYKVLSKTSSLTFQGQSCEPYDSTKTVVPNVPSAIIPPVQYVVVMDGKNYNKTVDNLGQSHYNLQTNTEYIQAITPQTTTNTEQAKFTLLCKPLAQTNCEQNENQYPKLVSTEQPQLSVSCEQLEQTSEKDFCINGQLKSQLTTTNDKPITADTISAEETQIGNTTDAGKFCVLDHHQPKNNTQGEFLKSYEMFTKKRSAHIKSMFRVKDNTPSREKHKIEKQAREKPVIISNEVITPPSFTKKTEGEAHTRTSKIATQTREKPNEITKSFNEEKYQVHLTVDHTHTIKRRRDQVTVLEDNTTELEPPSFKKKQEEEAHRFKPNFKTFESFSGLDRLVDSTMNSETSESSGDKAEIAKSTPFSVAGGLKKLLDECKSPKGSPLNRLRGLLTVNSQDKTKNNLLNKSGNSVLSEDFQNKSLTDLLRSESRAIPVNNESQDKSVKDLSSGVPQEKSEEDLLGVPQDKTRKDLLNDVPQDKTRKDLLSDVPQHKTRKDLLSDVPQDKTRKDLLSDLPQDKTRKDLLSDLPQDKTRKDLLSDLPQDKTRKDLLSDVPQDKTRKDLLSDVPQDKTRKDLLSDVPQDKTTSMLSGLLQGRSIKDLPTTNSQSKSNKNNRAGCRQVSTCHECARVTTNVPSIVKCARCLRIVHKGCSMRTITVEYSVDSDDLTKVNVHHCNTCSAILLLNETDPLKVVEK